MLHNSNGNGTEDELAELNVEIKQLRAAWARAEDQLKAIVTAIGVSAPGGAKSSHHEARGVIAPHEHHRLQTSRKTAICAATS